MENELGSTLAMALIEATLEERYSLPGTTIDMSRHHANFFNARMEKERMRFDQLFSRYAKCEDWMVWFVLANGYSNDMIVEATIMDRQRFYICISKTAMPITISFVVPFYTVPVKMAETLPLYPRGGGVMHLCYRDMHEWFFHQFYLQEQNVGVMKSIDLFKPLAKKVAIYFSTLNPVKWKKGKKYCGHNNNATIKDNRKQLIVNNTISIDMERLTSIVPACIKTVMERARFPKFNEAKSLISTFKMAGLKQESLFEWFEQMNVKYANGDDTQKRFNYVYWWEQISYKARCEWIIEDTRKGRLDNVNCPFIGDITADIEDVQKMCAPTEQVAFTGPYNLTRRFIYRRGDKKIKEEKQEKEKEEELKIEDIFGEDSSSSNSNNGEEEEEEKLN